ncbi:MAG: PadR family transcriptional regulator [Acidobacteriaceae bacterium]
MRRVNRKTTTTESLLGLLSLGPMSGYEIRQLIAESIGNFWSESYGQIYPGLKQLVAEGLAEMKEERLEGRPAKKIYSLTERGQERLREWLAIPVVEQVPRNELLLKIFFGDRGELPLLREQVEGRLRALEDDLVRYRAIEARIHGMEPHPGKKFWLMTVRYGMAEANALRNWCDSCLREMQ